MAGLKHWAAIAGLSFAAFTPFAHADTALLNVSYDVTRELYKDIDTAFIADYKQKTGQTFRAPVAWGVECAGFVGDAGSAG